MMNHTKKSMSQALVISKLPNFKRNGMSGMCKVCKFGKQNHCHSHRKEHDTLILSSDY